MTNPKFTSAYTGQDVESAITKALQLDTFEYQSNEVIDGQTFHILWKVKPTNTNQANGIAIHPTSGKMFDIISINGVLSAHVYITEEDVEEVKTFPSGGFKHTHTTTAVLPTDTYVTEVNSAETHLSLKTKTAKVLPTGSETTSKLEIATIQGINGTTKASKAKAGTPVSVAKVGEAVKYGTANVGTEITGLARRAATPTRVGSANVAPNATTVGLGNANRASSKTSVITSINGTPFEARIEEETLILGEITPSITQIWGVADTLAGTTTIREAVETNTEMYGVTAEQISVKPATEAPSTQTILPAVANGIITPYDFTDVDVPIAAPETVVATGQVSAAGQGATVITGFDATTNVLTSAEIVTGGTSGTAVISSITTTKNLTTELLGSTDECLQPDHVHDLTTEPITVSSDGYVLLTKDGTYLSLAK